MHSVKIAVTLMRQNAATAAVEIALMAVEICMPFTTGLISAGLLWNPPGKRVARKCMDRFIANL